MSSIWNALVPETNKAVDKYFSQIVEEIATNLVRKCVKNLILKGTT